MDPSIRETIGDAIRRGWTLDEIRAVLEREFGVEIPRSTLGDYRQRMEKNLKRLMEAREIAGVWIAKIGEQPDSQTGQLLAEMLKTIALQTMAQLGENEEGPPAMDLMLAAKAIDHIASAQKKDQEFRARLYAQWRSEMEQRAKAAEEQVADVARTAGLTDEAAARIREIVMGVVG